MTDSGSRRAGFTLLEVVLALAILAMAVVFLLAIRSEAIETGIDAIEVRRLQMLADMQMARILAGEDVGPSGGFRDDDLEGDYDDYEWTLEKTPLQIRGERKDVGGSGGGQATVEATRVKLTVRAPSGREIEIYGWLYEEAKRGDQEGSSSKEGE